MSNHDTERDVFQLKERAMEAYVGQLESGRSQVGRLLSVAALWLTMAVFLELPRAAGLVVCGLGVATCYFGYLAGYVVHAMSAMHAMRAIAGEAEDESEHEPTP
jgi:hypothetical protein